MDKRGRLKEHAFRRPETFAKPHELPIKIQTAVIPVQAGTHLKISETYFIQ
ncbi:hypothetical protein [Neisseria weixii]|uniref:hypothetical protein n=1 Tax=Neisseria weixii TaxID=1853276 RepID=UPI00359F4CB8